MCYLGLGTSLLFTLTLVCGSTCTVTLFGDRFFMATTVNREFQARSSVVVVVG